MDSPLDIENADLRYVAEGNANIVLKLPESKHVLRLPKADKTSSDVRDRELLSYLQKCQRYAAILKQLCENKHVYLPHPIEISARQRQRLNSFILPYRPKNRLEKEFRGQYAVLMRDATVGVSSGNLRLCLLLDSFKDLVLADLSTYSIEIKPKQGWQFDSSLNNIFKFHDLNMCRYCCMQYLKMKNGKILARSNYCPMDLFSGDCSRMKKAVEHLIEEPQNNLRIFKNGELVYGESNRNETALQSLYEEIGRSALLSYKDQENNKSNIQNELKGSKGQLKLPASSILQRIIELQLLAKDNMAHMAAKKSCDFKSYNALESLVLKQLPLQVEEMTPEEQYMIGATLMDASIMITFNLCVDGRNSGCECVKIVNGKSYYVSVTLLDLDPKPDNHFTKYLKQTNESFAAAKELAAKTKAVCL